MLIHLKCSGPLTRHLWDVATTHATAPVPMGMRTYTTGDDIAIREDHVSRPGIYTFEHTLGKPTLSK